MKNLNPSILDYLVNKTGKAQKTIRNQISNLKRRFPHCTQNAIAHIYALENGLSVLSMLDEEDKTTVPSLEIQKPTIIKEKAKKRVVKNVVILDFESSNYFINGHVSEINKAYNSGCYTCVFVLFRKLIENLLIDVLRTKFPESGGLINKEQYFNIKLKRYHDFSMLIDNLNKKKNEFSHNEKKIIERIVQLCIPFKKDANDKTHSLFHLVESKVEIDSLSVKQIIELLKQLNDSVKK